MTEALDRAEAALALCEDIALSDGYVGAHLYAALRALVAEHRRVLAELDEAHAHFQVQEARIREARRVKPPTYLALDLWMAMGMGAREFDAYYERNGWADTWANLLGEVRKTFRGETCGWVENGEPCVISIVGHIGRHMGASDVGSSEPLPLTPDGQEKNR